MVTVLVNTVRVRVLTEDGQTLPVQLSAQWTSASQMSAEVFQVRDNIFTAALPFTAYHSRPVVKLACVCTRFSLLNTAVFFSPIQSHYRKVLNRTFSLSIQYKASH